jgi:gliding motility-associated-like protein
MKLLLFLCMLICCSLASGQKLQGHSSLIWASYFGGNNVSYGHAVAIDKSGNVYITGATGSEYNIAGANAVQPTLGGASDAYIAKFTSTGLYLWSSYLGGAGDETGFAIAIDKSGNVYVAGYTGSVSGIATANGWQPGLKGYYDAFLVKFSPSGARLWGTYLGDGGDDRAFGVATDAADNVIITGYTTSKSGIATAGAYQTSFGGDEGDVFIAKYTTAGKLMWSSYFGKGGNDRGNCVATDAFGNIYVAGITSSVSGMASPGAFQPNYLGPSINSSNAFIAKFSPAGMRVWSTYFGAQSQAHSIASDKNGNIVITGDTNDSSGNIASLGANQAIYGGGNNDAFVAKFNPLGARLWSTYFGGKKDDHGYGVATDDSDNIFLTGPTGSDTLIAGPGAYQQQYGGNNDTYLARFSPAGPVDWSTYFGGNGAEIGYAVATDRKGYVYVTGQTASITSIATPGAYQEHKVGGSDGFIAKFGYKYKVDAGVYQVLSPKGGYCPGSYPVTMKLKNFGSERLDSVNITWTLNGKTENIYHWKGRLKPNNMVEISFGDFSFPVGIDTVKAWTTAPNAKHDSFPENDTATSIIEIYALPKASAGPDTILYYDQIYIMQGSGGIIYKWIPAKYLSSSLNPNASAKLSDSNENYTLVVTNQHGCIDTAQVMLKVRPKLSVSASTSKYEICFGDKLYLYATGKGGYAGHYHFYWPIDSLKGDTVFLKAAQSGWHIVILTDNCSPAQATDSVYIKVYPLAKAAFTTMPAKLVTIKRPVIFMNHSKNATMFYWAFGNTDSRREVSPRYIYRDTGIYKITLVAFGQNGCRNDTIYKLIDVGDGKLYIYVPNAFSPNGDGTNDIFEIHGSGIVDYSYNIYNRWGEQVFQSSPDQNTWDGNYKGTPVEEGIYLYQLDVTGVDNDHHYLSGTVQVLR